MLNQTDSSLTTWISQVQTLARNIVSDNSDKQLPTTSFSQSQQQQNSQKIVLLSPTKHSISAFLELLLGVDIFPSCFTLTSPVGVKLPPTTTSSSANNTNVSARCRIKISIKTTTTTTVTSSSSSQTPKFLHAVFSHRPQLKIKTEQNVQKEIIERTNELAPGNNICSNEDIELTVYLNNNNYNDSTSSSSNNNSSLLNDLTIIILPGIIVSSSSSSLSKNEEILKELSEEVIFNELQTERDQAAAIISCLNSQNSKSEIENAKKSISSILDNVDPQRYRSIGVNVNSSSQVLKNSVDSRNMEWFSISSSTSSTSEKQENEKEEPTNNNNNNNNANNVLFITKLQKLFTKRIESKLPQLRRKCRELIGEIEDQLEDESEKEESELEENKENENNDDNEAQFKIICIVDSFVKRMQQNILNGYHSSSSSSSSTLQHSINQLLLNFREDLKFFKEICNKEILSAEKIRSLLLHHGLLNSASSNILPANAEKLLKILLQEILKKFHQQHAKRFCISLKNVLLQHCVSLIENICCSSSSSETSKTPSHHQQKKQIHQTISSTLHQITTCYKKSS